jgi:hypothetical protein
MTKKELEMVIKKKILGILALTAVFITFLNGCATNIASQKIPHWDKKPIEINSREYTVLGAVKLEKKWFGILGISIPFLVDGYLYQNGGATYSDLLDEAQKKYPEADAVIDVVIDYESSIYAIFYAQRKSIMTGIAIKFIKEPQPNNPALDIRLK